MQNTTRQNTPRSVAIAVQLIWLSVVVEALVMVAEYDGASNSDALWLNGFMLAVYGMVNHQIARRRNWARMAYAVLVAFEVAVLLAFGLDDATDLEASVTYLTLPMEILTLTLLFGTAGDTWFKGPLSE